MIYKFRVDTNLENLENLEKSGNTIRALENLEKSSSNIYLESFIGREVFVY